MPDRVAHSSDLAISSLVNDEPQHPRLYLADRCRRGQAVFQLDTFSQSLERWLADAFSRALDMYKIFLLDAETRMRQTVRQLAVVGQYQKTLGVGVEPTDREYTRLAWHEFDHGLPPMSIFCSRDHADGFVQQIVNERRRNPDIDTVDFDAIIVDVHPTTQDRRVAVDRDAARFDQCLAFSSGAPTRFG
jgi:hypothetical protein